ncbi:MAG TPA: hypothetical protein VFS21_29945 [Roseiflexaceae bacterium]|nr:hypothetical protein [Roseiflexaceae bacterium]
MTIAAGLFDTHQDADQALAMLERAGFPRETISVVARSQDQQRSVGGAEAHTAAEDAARVDSGAFAFGGAAIGGLLGLLAGLGALAIPGIGPVLAVGTLGAALGGTAGGAAIGGAAGGLVGALAGRGLGEEEAHVYAEGVRRGGILITVDADGPDRVEQAQRILHEAGAIDHGTRRSQWQEQGWNRFDDQGEPWSSETVRAEQQRPERLSPLSGAEARRQDWPDHTTPTTTSEERSHSFANDVQSDREISSHTNAEGSFPGVGATGPGVPVTGGAQQTGFPPKIGTGTGQVSGAPVPNTQRQDDDTPVFNNANDTAPTTPGQTTADGDYPTLGTVPGTAQPDIVDSGTGRPATGRDVPNQDYPTGKPMRGSGDQPRDADLGDEEEPGGSPTGRFRTN